MAWADFDPAEILKRLTARGVDFVVVGGFAAVIHGSPRVTQDLDLCYSRDPENLRALGDVLTELNSRLYGTEEELPFVADERTLKGTEVLTLQTDLGKLDLLARPSGSTRYADLKASADRVDIGDLLISIVSIPDLIAMKRAAGRPKDLADVAELEAIKRLASP
jgi:predicted nucleotidyltransferase